MSLYPNDDIVADLSRENESWLFQYRGQLNAIAESRLAESKLATTADWAPHWDEIYDLYIVKQRPLREVQEHMRTHYGFDKEDYKYKHKFKKYRMVKYTPGKKLDALAIKDRERRIEGKESIYYIHGVPVDLKKLWERGERLMKSNKCQRSPSCRLSDVLTGLLAVTIEENASQCEEPAQVENGSNQDEIIFPAEPHGFLAVAAGQTPNQCEVVPSEIDLTNSLPRFDGTQNQNENGTNSNSLLEELSADYPNHTDSGSESYPVDIASGRFVDDLVSRSTAYTYWKTIRELNQPCIPFSDLPQQESDHVNHADATLRGSYLQRGHVWEDDVVEFLWQWAETFGEAAEIDLWSDINEDDIH